MQQKEPTKDIGKPVQIAPDFYQIALPIPLKSLGSVFVYLVKSGEHNLLIDTGWNTEECYYSLKNALKQVDLKPSQLQKIVISHLHPDHYGLSSRLKEEAPESTIIMHRKDALTIKDNQEKFGLFIKRMNEWARIQGVPQDEVKAMMDSSLPMLKFSSPAKPDIEVIGGEVIRVGDAKQFAVISTPGHTIGNICLYETTGSEILFSGDHVLPTITPNVSLSPLYEGGDPLGDYLRSLEQLKVLKVKQVLPSHEYIFTNLSKRIEEIENHHKDRLDDTLSALDGTKEGISGYTVSSRMHWYTGSWEKLTPWEKRAALMETLAHLEYLKRRGQVAEIQEGSGTESRILYSAMKSG